VAKIPTATAAVILGHLEMKDHHLIPAPGVLHGALVGRLDSQLWAAAIVAARLRAEWPGPDINAAFALYPYNIKAR
jgi:hypothetical protein